MRPRASTVVLVGSVSAIGNDAASGGPGERPVVVAAVATAGAMGVGLAQSYPLHPQQPTGTAIAAIGRVALGYLGLAAIALARIPTGLDTVTIVLMGVLVAVGRRSGSFESSRRRNRTAQLPSELTRTGSPRWCGRSRRNRSVN